MSQSQPNVVYSCGSCGFPLNLSSSNGTMSGEASKLQKPLKKGVISFASVDLSRFTQVDEVSCFTLAWGWRRPKTKLLCRKCGAPVGYGYGEPPAASCSFDAASSSSSFVYEEYQMSVQALQLSEGAQ